MELHIGVTASRSRMKNPQIARLYELLKADVQAAQPEEVWFHHGDAVGGDAKAHDTAKVAGCKTHCHPPENNKDRAYKTCDRTENPKPYLVRNRDIVNATSKMYVLPDSFGEKLRSGTWSTWRFARREQKPWTIIYPDGTTESG